LPCLLDVQWLLRVTPPPLRAPAYVLDVRSPTCGGRRHSWQPAPRQLLLLPFALMYVLDTPPTLTPMAMLSTQQLGSINNSLLTHNNSLLTHTHRGKMYHSLLLC
jgi:hypothetical protein